MNICVEEKFPELFHSHSLLIVIVILFQLGIIKSIIKTVSQLKLFFFFETILNTLFICF